MTEDKYLRQIYHCNPVDRTDLDIKTFDQMMTVFFRQSWVEFGGVRQCNYYSTKRFSVGFADSARNVDHFVTGVANRFSTYSDALGVSNSLASWTLRTVERTLLTRHF